MKELEGLECFKVDVSEHIATVTMSVPPVNAQNRRFRDEIQHVFDTLGETDAVRCIILTGEGRAFSAGADLRERSSMDAGPGAYVRHNRQVRAAFDCVLECPKPVIAAINGPAIGAGCVLALCCDILLASGNAFMAMTEVEVGLAGGVRHTMRFFGQSDARLMIFTARRMGADELLRLRVVSAVHAPEHLLVASREIAAEIASKSPSAVRAAKRSFGLTEEMPLRDGYRFEQTQTAALSGTADTQEALRAFAEKRKPVFK